MQFNIIYSTSGVDDRFRSRLDMAIEKSGNSVSSHSVRIGRIPVEQALGKYRRGEGVVLIVPITFDNAHLTVEMLNGFRCSVPDLRVVVIINKSELGSVFLQDLLKEGYTLALVDTEATPEKVAQLIVYGREYADAKRYYGFNDSIKFKDNVSAFSFMTKESALIYMNKPLEEGESYAARLKWIKEHSERNVYIDSIRKLESVVKEEIARSDLFESNFAEDFGAAARIDEKKGVSFKNIVQSPESEDTGEFELKIKREISSAVSKAVKRVGVGVASTVERLGSTHQSLIVANFLAQNGYRVAVIEDYRNERPALDALGEAYGKKADASGCFRLKGIDFYPSYNIDELAFLNPKNYQFFVFDLGVLGESNLNEFGTCIKQILLCGSQPWNFDKLQEVFAYFQEEEQRAQINYAFLSTPVQDRKEIKSQMRPLNKIFFTKHYPDFFQDVADDDMCYDIFHEYIDVKDDKKKGKILSSIKKYFE